MVRWIYTGMVGLFGAVAIHLALVFLVPSQSNRTAYAQLAALAPAHVLVPLTEPFAGNPPLLRDDPLQRAVACRFDITDAPTRLEADGRVPLWTLSVFDPVGVSIFSISDRTSPDRDVDIVVATPFQAVELRRDAPDAIEGTVIVETTSLKGLLVLRAIQPDDSFKPIVDAFLTRAACGSM